MKNLQVFATEAHQIPATIQQNSYSRTQNPNNNCNNCLKAGHDARTCSYPCKLCGWQLGPPSHPFYRCQRYIPKAQQIENTSNQPQQYQQGPNQAPPHEANFIESVYNTEERKEGRTKRIRIEDIVNDDEPMPTQLPEPKSDEPRVKGRQNQVKPSGNPHLQMFVNKILRTVNVNTNLGELCEYAPSISTEVKRQLAPRARKKPLTQFNISDTIPSSATYSPACPRTWLQFANIEANGLLDGGSSTNLVSLGFLKRLGIRDITPSNIELTPFKGPAVKTLGKISLKFCLGGTDCIGEFHVVPNIHYPILLGRKSLMELAVTTSWG
ncbi:hypothetical protein NEOLI_005423, partial [Neolecta irregularis DAH-3]